MESSGVGIKEQLANTFEAIPKNMQLNKILEKRNIEDTLTELRFHTGSGFPKPKRREVRYDFYFKKLQYLCCYYFIFFYGLKR